MENTFEKTLSILMQLSQSNKKWSKFKIARVSWIWLIEFIMEMIPNNGTNKCSNI
jgi:hypothetical protein